jgi:hypothetical protein
MPASDRSRAHDTIDQSRQPRQRVGLRCKTRSAPLRAQASGTPQHQHRDPKQHQHHDPKSDDRQFGSQVHDQILNGKTGEADLRK